MKCTLANKMRAFRNSTVRFGLLGLTTILANLCGVTQAQEPADISFGEERSHFQSFGYDYYRNKMWPMPFRADDTRSVLKFFSTQSSIGWRLHNTVDASMYSANGQLTDAGKAHVKWIVTRAPQDRRVVFVKKGIDQRQTAQRVESTQLAISELVPVGPLPQLYLTDRASPGSSGAYQTAVNRAMSASVPSPRLTPASQGQSQGSSTQ